MAGLVFGVVGLILAIFITASILRRRNLQPAKQVKVLAEKGIIAKGVFKWNRAIRYFTKAMKNASTAELVNLHNHIGECYFMTGDFVQALK